MMRRLPTKKILVATLGVGAVSYVVACSSSSSGNLMPPDSGVNDSGQDVVSSGNLMPPIDSGGGESAADTGNDAGADVSSSGNLMAPLDAGDGGG